MNKKICVLMCAVSIASVCGLRGMDNPPGELGYFYRYDHCNNPYWTPENEKVEKKEKKKDIFFDSYTSDSDTDEEMLEPVANVKIFNCKKVFDSEKELIEFVKKDPKFKKFFQKEFVKEQEWKLEWKKEFAEELTGLTPMSTFLGADENFLIALSIDNAIYKYVDFIGWMRLQIFNLKTKKCDRTIDISEPSNVVYDSTMGLLALGSDGWGDGYESLYVYNVKFDDDYVNSSSVFKYPFEKKSPEKKAENIKKILFTEESLIVITQKYDGKYYLYSCSIGDLKKCEKKPMEGGLTYDGKLTFRYNC